MKSLSLFVLGVIVGAVLLFGTEHRHLIELLISPAHRVQAAVAGDWQGTVSVQGYDVDFALALKTDGKTLSGVISSSRVGDVPCDQVQFGPGDAVAFTAHVDDKSAVFTGKLTPDGHAMSGTLTGNLQGSWSLTKKG